MQRPIRGYRGCSRISTTHLIRSHVLDDDNNVCDRLSQSNSNSNEFENKSIGNQSIIKSQSSSLSSSAAINDDFESIISNLRPLKINPKKAKHNSNISKQKADLTQINIKNNRENNIDEKTRDKQSNYCFPKSDIGSVKSNDFIRHNSISKIKYF